MDHERKEEDGAWPILRPAWAQGIPADVKEGEIWSSYVMLLAGAFVAAFFLLAGFGATVYWNLATEDVPQSTFTPMQTETPEAPSRALDGTWVLESGEDDGVKLPLEKVRTGKLVIDGENYRIDSADESQNYEIALMEADSPKMLILLGQDKLVVGIYELDGDTLRISLGKPGEDSPRQFSHGNTIRIWKRTDPAPPNPPAPQP